MQVSSGEDRLLEKLPEAVGFLVLSEDDSVLAAGSFCLSLSVEKGSKIWLEAGCLAPR